MKSLAPFFIMMGGYGLLNFIYAFKEPPQILKGILKVPGFFIFLPDHLVIPVGRIFMGMITFIILTIFFIKMNAVYHPAMTPVPFPPLH